MKNLKIQTPLIKTISDITTPEVISMKKISNYHKNQLIASIKKITRPKREALFIPDKDGDVKVDSKKKMILPQTKVQT